jgi:hypothetical protein
LIEKNEKSKNNHYGAGAFNLIMDMHSLGRVSINVVNFQI